MEEHKTREEGRAQGEIAEFVALFPQVEPEDIPQEVWEEVRDGRSLALSYALWRCGKLEQDLAALKRRRRGEDLSPGSVRSAGASLGGGTLAAYWDAYAL